ncbi:MAG: acyltransferase [Bacteroidetes bacterium]|nr:acyltransferase [Bacteroidota bacterium]
MNRNFGLDIIRVIALWIVLLVHANYTIDSLNPFSLGGVGMELFFVLSGFLIGNNLIRDLGKDNSLTQVKAFLVKRWFKTLPLYYTILIVKFIFTKGEIGYNIIYYFFFLQNNFYGVSFFGVTWSLVIEEWFYLFIPFYLYLIKKTSSHRIVLVLLSLAVLGSFILRIYFVLYRNTPFEGLNANVLVRAEPLILGVILAYLNNYFKSIYKVLEHVVFFVAGLLIMFGFLQYYTSLNSVENTINQNEFVRIIIFAVMGLSIALCTPYMATFKDFSTHNFVRKLIHTFVTKSSLYTYSIFLLHTFVYHYSFTYLTTGSHLVDFIIAVVLTYSISFFSYEYFEEYFLSLRGKVIERMKTRSAVN